MFALPRSAAQQDPIYLSDEVMERGPNVECLLDIVYTMDTSVIDCGQVYSVLDLAKKWSFDKVRQAIHNVLPNPNRYNFHRFQVSIKLEDPKLIAGFVKRDHHVVWNNASGGSPADFFANNRRYRPLYGGPAPGLIEIDAMNGGKLFEIGTWRYIQILLTPPTVVWALLRATHVGTITPAKINYDKVAEEFERLLTLACTSSFVLNIFS